MTDGVQKIIDDYGRKCDEERAEKARKEEILQLVSITDRMDGICRAVIRQYEIKKATSDDRAFYMFGEFTNPEWYRMKRAEHLLRTRYMRRWFPLFMGEKMGKDAVMKSLISKSNFCGKKYKGQIEIARFDVVVLP